MGVPPGGYSVYPGGSQGFAAQPIVQGPPPPAQFPQPRQQPRQPALQPPPQQITAAPPPQREYRGLRGEDQEPQRLAPLSIPTPEQLGIVNASSASRRPQADWSLISKRLKELGSVGYSVDHLPDGNCRFVCKLATAEFGRSHTIEAQGATDIEAAEQALAKAERYKKN